MGKKCYIFPADFMEYNFINIKEVVKNNKYIKWGISLSKYETLQENDIIYLYYHDIIGEDEGRILFSATVKGKQINKKQEKEEWLTKNETIPYAWALLGDIKVIGFNDRDKFDFSFHNLKNEYDIYVNQTQQFIGDLEHINNDYKLPDNKTKEKYIKNLVLLKDLKISENNNKKVTINDVIDFFSRECEYCSNMNLVGKTYKTFHMKNGIKYFETHHFIFQSVLRDTKQKNELKMEIRRIFGDDFIESDINKICLCPVCHREIHYGTLEERKKRVDFFFDKISKKIKIEEKDKIRKYIYLLYDISV